MSAEPITDAEVVEVGQEIVPAQPPSLSIAPAGKASELVERLDAIKEAMDTAMVKDTDYGVIPGTGSKPTLLKPGAEKLMALFQLDLQCEEEDTRAGDHLTVKTRAIAFYAPTGARLGYGVGECSTREKKYAYRQEERVCPSCKQPAIIKGRKEYGGGWLCWNKKGGCGQKFRDGDTLIETQAVGTVDNPDLPDSWNTVRKMAEKRAKVDAVLAVTSASAIFTQDVEDSASAAEVAPEQPPAAVNANASKLLSAANRKKVVDAIEASGQPLALFLAACNVDSTDDLTVANAFEIGKLLDTVST